MAVSKIDGSRQIKDASIVDAQLSASAAIALSKLAEAVIQADGGQAFTADQSLGGNKLTSVGTPTTGTDAANKSYVDAAAAGIDWKASVRAATTANGALATAYENTDVIDGVTLATGDRILLKDQTTASENGIYVVNASGSPTRATDADSNAEVTAGIAVFVEQGTANADTGWLLTNDGAITLGTTNLTFTQFTSLGQVTAGAGLTKTGNTLDVVGTANRITVAADAIDIGTDVVTLTGSQTLTNKTIGGGQISGNISGNAANVTGTVAIANGVNTTYTLANTPVAGSEHVYLNGLLQEPGAGNDYTISGATITYLTAPVTGDKIRVSYRR